MSDLNAILRATPYTGYAYSYPHKSAYRAFEEPISLQSLWQGENRDALYLYLHIPFCEMRCGFCNLFTTANPREDFTYSYLEALKRQAAQVAAALGEARFARFAIGGGTPTFLHCNQLDALFDMMESTFGIDPHIIPVSVETSPRTADCDKLRILRDRGVDRISIGIQSFVEAETTSVGRAQKTGWAESALDRIRQAGFATLNLDLIYGLPRQTEASWLCSLQTALRYAPEELFLYPLYVRQFTGLGRKNQSWDETRLALYRTGREFLLSNGYRQISMRMFARIKPSSQSEKLGVVYCCQDDGMVGIGCGARSYTRDFHYASEYAVGAGGVRDILHNYARKTDADFAAADYGFALDAEEQRRRYIIQSLLQVSGLDCAAYHCRFGTSPMSDFQQLCDLESAGLAKFDMNMALLTEEGIEHSDSIGPWLYSLAVTSRMEAYELH